MNATQSIRLSLRKRVSWIIAYLGVLSLALVQVQNGHGASQPLEGVTDLSGKAVDPFLTGRTNKALVFVFLANECPICNRSAPEIRRIAIEFAKKNVGLWLVHPDGEETAEAIRDHAKEYQLNLPILRDPKHSLVRRAEAHVTPEAAVFFPNGRLAYCGRIDDRYVDFGKERPAATKHDLEEAVTAVLAGNSPTPSRTRAIGCYIPELRERLRGSSAKP